MLLRKMIFAARRPDLAIRRVRGRSPIEIGLSEIARYVPNPRVIVEAGALDGTDTALMATRWPGAMVHAFEPVPSAFAKTELQTKHLTNVRRYQLALSDREGPQILHVSSGEDGSERPDSSSLMMPSGHLDAIPGVRFDEAITVRAVTLDEWSKSESVTEIDIMWLDLQGMELPVLRAAKGVLSSTRCVMMEVSRREMYAHGPLYPEVVSWMDAQGFHMALDRVSFHFGNALFVNRRLVAQVSDYPPHPS